MKILKMVMVLSTLFCFYNLAFADTAENTYRVDDHINNLNKAGQFGLGLMLGSTSGITGKFWTSETTALDVGVSFINTNTAILADYLWHWRDAFTPSQNGSLARSFVPYIGAGVIAGFGGSNDFFYQGSQNFQMGVRVPIGIEFIPRTIPLGFFAEVDPGIGFVPDGFTFVEGNLGGRYYF